MCTSQVSVSSEHHGMGACVQSLSNLVIHSLDHIAALNTGSLTEHPITH